VRRWGRGELEWEMGDVVTTPFAPPCNELRSIPVVSSPPSLLLPLKSI